MSSIEITGKCIEEATQLAIEQLGVTEDDVYVEIVEEGAKGFLGIGQSPAKVRVTLKDPNSSINEINVIQNSQVSESDARDQAIPADETKDESSDQLVPDDNINLSEIARSTLQSIVDGIGFGGTAVIVDSSDEFINLNIEGGDSGVLIGKHGQTINAIQYVVILIVNKHLAKRVRINIDVEGYRARRAETLTNRAKDLADKVRESGEEAVLEPLDASERRIIHTALADDPDVCTYSEGMEPERYIVISPKK